MSRSSDPPDDTGDVSYNATSSKMEEIKCRHMMKLESAAESIGKDYGKYMKIEGTTIRMMNNMVEMLEAWMDLDEYRAHQNALTIAGLMKENFKSMQENTNNIKTTIDTQITYSTTIEVQLQELKKNVLAIQAAVTDIQSKATHPSRLLPNSQPPTMLYMEMAT
ncbi:hypothetical protein EDD85DRAFT_794757 [Armillaria nabsnona]|nr:hypothetical protein EDD85DRAFT_794757 [Armillaria nabsnona]